MDSQKLWKNVLERIRPQLSEANFRIWFGKTALEQKDKNHFIVYVESSFIKQNILAKYPTLLSNTFKEVYPDEAEISIEVKQSLKETEVEFEFTTPTVKVPTVGLNPKYNLENFVVGLSNNLAFAAARAVVQTPGTTYNPLFIYGGTGVGKTHLMQAIGNELFKKNPGLKIIYCTSEKYTNDFIQSIQNKKTSEFRAKYRNCDLFLVDDIQFISGRDSTQEEFFHTFNELHTKNSQIILTSDRTPDQMKDLESRLRSRFQGGLMVDIQNPDFDTRVAILRAKCMERNEHISDEILTIIAQSQDTNARELEGKLIQIVQAAKLTNQILSEDVVHKYLGTPSHTAKAPDYKKVITGVNQYFHVKTSDLIGPRRKRDLVIPRQIVMYFLYEECKLPYERIGDILGGRDHTTILHGVEKMRSTINRDRELQRMIIEIRQIITQG